MQVACPQCGAPVPALTETCFYRCAYCSSSFVTQDDQAFERFIVPHRRDDRVAWSALADRLERNRSDTTIEQGNVEFTFVPFWSLTLESAESRLVPALDNVLPELGTVTLPGVDLRYPEDGEVLPAPAISLSATELRIGGLPVRRRSLVYLPIYLLSYRSQGDMFQAVVSGADRKVYARTLPAPRGDVIPIRHAAMMGLFLSILIVEGFSVRHLGVRAGAFILTFLAAYVLYYLILRKDV